MQGIKEAKQRQLERLKRDLNISTTKDVWHAVLNITSYKSRSTLIMCEAMLPDEFNTFNARFDLLNKVSC